MNVKGRERKKWSNPFLQQDQLSEMVSVVVGCEEDFPQDVGVERLGPLAKGPLGCGGLFRRCHHSLHILCHPFKVSAGSAEVKLIPVGLSTSRVSTMPHNGLYFMELQACQHTTGQVRQCEYIHKSVALDAMTGCWRAIDHAQHTHPLF